MGGKNLVCLLTMSHNHKTKEYIYCICVVNGTATVWVDKSHSSADQMTVINESAEQETIKRSSATIIQTNLYILHS